jgi:hypothetical protein
MPRETLTTVVTLPDPQRLREFVGKAAQLKGQYRLIAEPSRLSISQQQRGYFHGHVVQVFADWLERGRQPLPLDDQGDPILSYHAYAKAILKEKCLKLPVIAKSGEVKGYITGSTEALGRSGMNDFIDRTRAYLWDTFELWTDDPDPEWRTKPARETEAARA